MDDLARTEVIVVFNRSFGRFESHETKSKTFYYRWVLRGIKEHDGVQGMGCINILLLDSRISQSQKK